MSTNQTAERLADLTFILLQRCQEKEAWLAEEHGLFQSEFRCLRLFGSDESLNNKQLAKRMNLSESRLTRLIDGLIGRGYMQREVDQKIKHLSIYIVRFCRILMFHSTSP
jgi:DNA-binding MarR family transcriptional regulator